MFFTQDDYKKIQQWLTKHSVKDTEFNEANIPFNGEETITIVQGNQNKKVFLKDLIAQVFNLGISDFVNITDKYDAPNISLEEAIRLIPSRARKEGQVITFLDREDHWHIYQFKGVLNQWNILDQWEDLFDWENLIIDSILPDEEDLTKSLPDENGNSYLSLKDREYNPEDFSGLGRIILRKNIVEIEDPIYGKVKKNYLYQDMFTQSNTIYEIRYDFDLNGEEITIPEGCVLDFKGGSLNNGSIIFNNTRLQGVYKMLNIKNLKGSLNQNSLDLKYIQFTSDTIEVYDSLKLEGITILKFKSKEYYLDIELSNFINIENRNHFVIDFNSAKFIDNRDPEITKKDISFIKYTNCHNFELLNFNYRGKFIPKFDNNYMQRGIWLDNCHDFNIVGNVENASAGCQLYGSSHNQNCNIDLKLKDVGYGLFVQGGYINNIRGNIYATGKIRRILYLAGVVDSVFNVTTKNLTILITGALITDNSIENVIDTKVIRGRSNNLTISINYLGDPQETLSSSISFFNINFSPDIVDDENAIYIKNPHFNLSANIYGTIDSYYTNLLSVHSKSKFIPNVTLHSYTETNFGWTIFTEGDANINAYIDCKDKSNPLQFWLLENSNKSNIRIVAPENILYLYDKTNANLEVDCLKFKTRNNFKTGYIKNLKKSPIIPTDNDFTNVNINQYAENANLDSFSSGENNYMLSTLDNYKYVLAQGFNTIVEIGDNENESLYEQKDNYKLFKFDNISDVLPKFANREIVIVNKSSESILIRHNSGISSVILGIRETLLLPTQAIYIKLIKVNGSEYPIISARPFTSTSGSINLIDGDIIIRENDIPVYVRNGEKIRFDGLPQGTWFAGKSRPNVELGGFNFYDTALNKPIWWTGSKWVDATGADV